MRLILGIIGVFSCRQSESNAAEEENSQKKTIQLRFKFRVEIDVKCPSVSGARTDQAVSNQRHQLTVESISSISSRDFFNQNISEEFAN